MFKYQAMSMILKILSRSTGNIHIVYKERDVAIVCIIILQLTSIETFISSYSQDSFIHFSYGSISQMWKLFHLVSN